jgi:hypothetical protein
MSDISERPTMNAMQLRDALAKFYDDNRGSCSVESRWLADQVIQLKEMAAYLYSYGAGGCETCRRRSEAETRFDPSVEKLHERCRLQTGYGT